MGNYIPFTAAMKLTPSRIENLMETPSYIQPLMIYYRKRPKDS